jgi:ATP-dependent protease ClpP protease subunit
MARTNDPGSLTPNEQQGEAVAREAEPNAQHRASILTAPSKRIPTDIVTTIRQLEQELRMPIWLLIQAGGTENRFPREGEEYDTLSNTIWREFFIARDDLPEEKVALVIDSPGGLPEPTYRLAGMLKRRCGGFVAVVPRVAASAATLLALAADEIVLGDNGELGPLDVQIRERWHEDRVSALDEVQALEALHAAAMQAFEQTMSTLLSNRYLPSEKAAPLALNFAAEMMRPLSEDLDSVHYTRTLRGLRVGHEYAYRLLRSNRRLDEDGTAVPRYSDNEAFEIARHLVRGYPDHDFIIDSDEATRIGLPTAELSPGLRRILDKLATQIVLATQEDGLTLIGRVE